MTEQVKELSPNQAFLSRIDAQITSEMLKVRQIMSITAEEDFKDRIAFRLANLKNLESLKNFALACPDEFDSSLTRVKSIVNEAIDVSADLTFEDHRPEDVIEEYRGKIEKLIAEVDVSISKQIVTLLNICLKERGIMGTQERVIRRFLKNYDL